MIIVVLWAVFFQFDRHMIATHSKENFLLMIVNFKRKKNQFELYHLSRRQVISLKKTKDRQSLLYLKTKIHWICQSQNGRGAVWFYTRGIRQIVYSVLGYFLFLLSPTRHWTSRLLSLEIIYSNRIAPSLCIATM